MHRRLASMGAAVLIALASVVPIHAQSEEAAVDNLVEVTGVEYAFTGLPTSLPAGTSLGLTNAGAEVHELVLGRIADGVTEPLEELLNMENPVGQGLIEIIGEAPLQAAPGETAEGTLPLDREGRYAVVCFIPVGLTDFGVLDQLASGTDPADLPEDVHEILGNPVHAFVGMKQEFIVTATGSTPGPLPSPTASTPADGSGGSESAAP